MTHFQPTIGQIQLVDEHAMWMITSGSGHFEVDFQEYQFAAPMTIFLSPGMYFQLKAGSLQITEVVFSRRMIARLADSRLLFQHVLSLAHLDVGPVSDTAGLQQPDQTLLNHSVQSWRNKNPFRAAAEEISLIFDVKHLVDSTFIERCPIGKLLETSGFSQENTDSILRKRVGLSTNKMLQRKLALEAQKMVVFTDKSVKEIAYDLGFSSSHYFNRFFRQKTTRTPLEFRKAFDFHPRDTFLEDLLFLIDKHYRTRRSTQFYADQLNMSIKTLCKKVRERSNLTTGEIIRRRLIEEARQLLLGSDTIKDVAFELGFEEPNHFSTFFKGLTGQTPGEYQKAHQKVHCL